MEVLEVQLVVLFGTQENTKELSDCYFTGSINAENYVSGFGYNGVNCGGLVGASLYCGDAVVRSYNTGRFTVSVEPNRVGCIGGLVGYIENYYGPNSTVGANSFSGPSCELLWSCYATRSDKWTDSGEGKVLSNNSEIASKLSLLRFSV